METNKHHMPSEVDYSGAPHHFSWAPGIFCPDEDVGCRDSEATEVDAKDCIAAIPIRSIDPTSRCAKKNNTCKPMKAKKKKSYGKDAPQNASRKVKPKEQKTKASDFKVQGPEILGQKVEERNRTEVYNESNFDFSKVPPPFCSCTGVARACYRCGAVGWQSSCCTRTISEYPLPVSPSKPGVRLGGRKMTIGAYTKLLCRLACRC